MIHTVGFDLKYPAQKITITFDKTECDRLMSLGYRLVHEPLHRGKSPLEFWVLYRPYREDKENVQDDPEEKIITVKSEIPITEAEAEMLRNTWENSPRIGSTSKNYSGRSQ